MATEAQPAKQAKLLVVEDDVMIRMVLADMLCELGYTVSAEAASKKPMKEGAFIQWQFCSVRGQL